MTIDDLIAALQALPPEQRKLPVLVDDDPRLDCLPLEVGSLLIFEPGDREDLPRGCVVIASTHYR